MKGWKVHYMNKIPGSRVQMSDSSFDVFDANGEHVVALRKNGAGQWMDVSEEEGLSGRHCLAPIPKDSRVHKINEAGHVSLDEKHEERKKLRMQFLCDKGQKVLSCAELSKRGWEFDEKQRVAKAPAPALESKS